jgi:hypothetical protein
MEVSYELPQSMKLIQNSLKPYIKQRKEVVLIRRILATHLSSHVNQGDGQSLTRPLSLLYATSEVISPEHGIKGLQKEYIRCARANIETRREFDVLRKEHQVHESVQVSHSHNDTIPAMESFLDVVKQRQKHERLRIVQDYVDVLCQKPAAAVEHLDAQLVLKDVDTLPNVPPEVLTAPIVSQSPGTPGLNTLLDQLEKSVLRAKLLLKDEQRLLERVKSRSILPSGGSGGRLHALGSTRNELISWIEAELASTGESSSTPSDLEATTTTENLGKDFFDSHLTSIHRQYNRYTKARQKLILAATARLEVPLSSSLEDAPPDALRKQPYKSSGIHIFSTYLDQIMSISNEQKSMAQQKSHLSISLAKQLKDSGQGLDRLSEESHLLPLYPIPTSRSNRVEAPASFADEVTIHERPDLSQRAHAWVFAADSAGKVTHESTHTMLEESGSTIEAAYLVLDELRKLLGNTDATDASPMPVADIWASLDGTLGVIKGDRRG